MLSTLNSKENKVYSSGISIVIPAYNEEKTIGHVLSDTIQVMDTLNVPYEIIVVDDGSTDKTASAASFFNTMVLSNKTNRGKGYALKKALQYARGNIIVTIDADGEHKPKEIPDLLRPLLGGADIVAGSRFLGNASQVTTKINKIGNSLFNFTIMTMTGRQVSDSQTGFRAFRRDALEKLNLESDGYEVETEITVKSLRNGFIFREVPITCERRKYSISKLKILSDGTKILKTILRANFLPIDHTPEIV